MSSLIWAIRLVNIDRNKMLALKEDAYSKGLATLLINTNPNYSVEYRQKITKKFFDYATRENTAKMIMNWNKKGKKQLEVSPVVEKLVNIISKKEEKQ